MVLQNIAIQENLVWKIKDLASNNQLSEALFLLRQFAEEKKMESLRKKVIALDGRLRELNYKTNAGILDSNYANVQISGIMSDVLKLTEKFYTPLSNYDFKTGRKQGFWGAITNFFH